MKKWRPGKEDLLGSVALVGVVFEESFQQIDRLDRRAREGRFEGRAAGFFKRDIIFQL